MAFRSLVGSLATLTTSVTNLTVLMVLRGEPGWICLMCCNADILFCVLVLHWVTSKDKPSSYQSTHASRNDTLDLSGGKATPAADHNAALAIPEKVASRDCKAAEDEIVELESQTTHLPVWPYEQAPASPAHAKKLPSSVTTEIRSTHGHPHHASATRCKSLNGRVLHKSRDGGSDCGDEVELHKIHVQTEVCIDSESSAGEGRWSQKDMRNASMEDAWGMNRSVSAEKMV